jgi:hypothetical protein
MLRPALGMGRAGRTQAGLAVVHSLVSILPLLPHDNDWLYAETTGEKPK